jgi:ankyrin repeat protein
MTNELCAAAQTGDCGKLRELLDGGGGASVVNERTKVMVKVTGRKFRTTALIQAVRCDQHAAVELLLERKADPNVAASDGITPLMEAAARGHLSILRTLLDRTAIAIDAVHPESGGTAFHMACIQDHADCAVELARHGCEMTRAESGETGKQIAERMEHTAVLAGLRTLAVEQPEAKQQSNDGDDQPQEGWVHELAKSIMPPAPVLDMMMTQFRTVPVETMTAIELSALELRCAAQMGDLDTTRKLLEDSSVCASTASLVNERTETTDAETGKKVRVTALVQAVADNQHAVVKLLLDHNADPNLPTSLGETPLMRAAAHGHLPILRTLLDRKAAIDAADVENGRTAFEYACDQGSTDCAVELVRHGCNTKLHGVPTKRCKLVQKLALRKAQQQPIDAVSSATAAGRVPQADEDAEQQKKAVKKAAANRKKKDRKKAKKAAEQLQPDHDSVCRPLLSETEAEAEAEPELQAAEDAEDAEPEPEADADWQSLMAALELRTAAQIGDCGKLRELLDGGGASVDERSAIRDKVTGKETFETTALIQAVIQGQHAAVELLLEHKANPNLIDSRGFTPLMEAAACGHLPVLQTLLDRKAIAIDAVSTENGVTAFHCACFYGHADCAVELVRRGCNTKLRTKDDKTGWDLAKQKGHGGLIKRCKGALKLALHKAQQQGGSTASPALATAAGGVPQADANVDQQKAAKKAAANRKKKDRKKAKKAAEQQRISQREAQIPECQAQQREEEPELEPEPEPVLDKRTQQLQGLAELGVQQWSVAQVLEWVALAELPPESVSAVIAAMESLDLDGDELLHLRAKMLQKKLAKHSAQNAEALAKQVIEQRDALLMLCGDNISESASPKSELSDILECPLCMELYSDDEAGLRVPRMLTSCGHTVCHGCITKMMTRVLAEGNAKPYKCPTCSKVTKVARGKAANLPKNFALAAAAEAL